MYAELYRYLILHKQLSLPGIGSFHVERKPAQGDFVNRQVLAPSFMINMETTVAQPQTSFFKWLGGALSVSDRDAVLRFNDFLFDLKKQISNGDTVVWQGVGELTRGLTGETKFTSAEIIKEAPVTAEKVTREKAEHMVRVGEEEKTAAEMEEMLTGTPVKKIYWWIAPLIIGFLAVAFITWHIIRYGFDIAAFANTIPLTPEG